MVAAVPRGEREPLLNIGQVLDRLRADFEDISIPKIRFLEAEGLVKPDRTPSGYRKFSEADIERLRYILRMQRDHYLPLKVIGEHLDAIDRGLEPPAVEPVVPTVPKVALGADGLPAPESFRRTDRLRLSRKELVKVAEIDEDLLGQLESFALITPSPTGHYDTDALVIAQTAVSSRTSASSRGTCVRSAPLRTARSGSSSRSWRRARAVTRARAPVPRRRSARSPRCRCGCTRPWSRPVCAASDAGTRPRRRRAGARSCAGSRLEDMREVDVLGVRVEMPSNQPIVLLREVTGERYLPIWIGAVEATAIAFAQQGVVPPRPLTHDLMKDILQATGSELSEVRITDVRDGVFYATLVFASGTEVSARPSDSIALALRTGTTIYCSEDVLAEAGLAAPAEEEDEVEAFREFLDHVSPDDFGPTAG